jgi:hypothetical protein
MQHHKKRLIEKWGSCGKYHNERLRYRFISDLSDSHLLHIIAWIKLYTHAYDDETLQLMEDEQAYRCTNYLFISDYQN